MSLSSAPSLAGFEDQYFWSHEGLRLHYRHYAGPQAADQAPVAPVVLCLPGLTRNARDFEALAPRLAQRLTVWCLDLRGRGESAYAKDPLSYVPLVYLRDVERLIESAKPAKLIVIGTSLGGIVAMLMAGALHEVLAGVVLNDIGPKIEPAGLARIRSYVGRGGPWPTWMHAAQDFATQNRDVYPAWQLADWLAFAKRLCRVHAAGRIVLDYDPRIAEPFKLPSGEAGVDLWPAFQALGGVPSLSIRGASSDILSSATQAEMARRMPDLRTIEVPNTGHAPTLDEPMAVRAIEQLVMDIIAQGPAAPSP